MTHYSISIHSYSGGKQPKSFSGRDKKKVIDSYEDYISTKEKEEIFCNDCYLKVSQNDIIVTSHERDPNKALKDCCSKLYNGNNSSKPGNMIVVDPDAKIVEEDGDDIDKDEDDILLQEEVERDPDDVPNDLKIDDEVVDKNWDGFLDD